MINTPTLKNKQKSSIEKRFEYCLNAPILMLLSYYHQRKTSERKPNDVLASDQVTHSLRKKRKSAIQNNSEPSYSDTSSGCEVVAGSELEENLSSLPSEITTSKYLNALCNVYICTYVCNTFLQLKGT
jgi:hypothetical protein